MADGAGNDEMADKDANDGCGRGPIVALAEWAIDGISLAEAILTVMYFDEDTYDPVVINVVFMFEPIVTTVVKVMIQTCFPDLLFPVLLWGYISEAVQCFLYLYFSNYVDEVLLLLPLLGGIQVFMMTMIYLWEALCKKKDTDSKEDKRVKACTEGCAEINVVCGLSIAAGVLPLICLTLQEEAPHREKSFEFVLAVYYWIIGIAGSEAKRLQERMKQIAGGERTMGFSAGVGNAVSGVVMVLQLLAVVAFLVYMNFLSWSWWFDDEINKTWDKVYMMMQMVGGIIFGVICCCICACMLCGGCAAALGGAAS
eukprot:CAMPEP_0194493144 /NCGR_PEP_ID=MMETSP0253-20130528/11461_1 /TAXON_ID=2966 /ORGANISM="Noctiluca scintillans" /LENGTH=311 /DNA_ID=CAMNT_0039334097 /DNA_START=18 /DNA_END=953 /DNA_ORIENTATION=-